MLTIAKKKSQSIPIFSVTRFPNCTISSKLFPSSASAPHIYMNIKR